ncbi:MAG: hypothetical protein OXI43_15600 [Candidatus Poribacteria bacterium]|nr:hypothetical protein [Candidatus Poribacteria bacterium]
MSKKIDLRSTEVNEVVKEVREMRMKISEKCGHDPDKIFAYYQKAGERLRKSGKYKFVDPEPPTENPTPIESSEDKVAD